MLQATLVSTIEELVQIHDLNQQNLKQHLTPEEKEEEGFVTWLYHLELLKRLHEVAPSIIVKKDDQVVGYALTLWKEASDFHTELDLIIKKLEGLYYHQKPLSLYSFYVMGQVCIRKDFRSKGIFKMLYDKHKEVYGNQFDLLITEISTSNVRSQKAHERIGFVKINTYCDTLDEWNVVVWDWNKK